MFTSPLLRWQCCASMHVAHPDFAKYSRGDRSCWLFNQFPKPDPLPRKSQGLCLADRRCMGRLLVISFLSKGFPCKHHIEELFIVVVSFCVFRTRNIFNFLINFNLYATIFKGAICLITLAYPEGVQTPHPLNLQIFFKLCFFKVYRPSSAPLLIKSKILYRTALKSVC